MYYTCCSVYHIPDIVSICLCFQIPIFDLSFGLYYSLMIDDVLILSMNSTNNLKVKN